MSTHSSQKSVLIVDDDVEFASSLRKILRKAGYEISVATNSVEALRLLGASSIDLIITDFRMGPLTGLELIHSIRTRQISTRVLLLTAFGDDKLRSAALNAGADAYLSKPVKRNEILDCVARLLSLTPGRIS